MRKEGSQIFVKIDEYKEIVEVVNTIKTKLEEAKDTLNKIDNLKNEEDTELDLWQAELEEIEKKVENIDKALFDTDSM